MNDSYETVRRYLMEHKVNPSFNRVKVMEYLISKENHPTADEIYNALKKELPPYPRLQFTIPLMHLLRQEL